MNNYSQEGEVLTLVASRAITSGEGMLAGSIFGVATGTFTSGATGEFQTCGVMLMAKMSAQAWAVGDVVYWDNTLFVCSSDSSVGPRIGAATAVAANPSSTGYVKLNETSTGTSGTAALHIRRRFTIAEVNAGATLLPALAGKGYRLLDASVISVGGAAGAVTTVDLIGTSTTARKLVAWAQASLTQSTLLRAGASGAAILADGASFTVNDAATAITIGKTGSSVTTATHVDVLVTYAVDAA